MTRSTGADVHAVPGPLAAAVAEARRAWDAADSTARLWQRDASLWTSSGEEQWLGWLDAPDDTRAGLSALTTLAERALTPGFDDVVVLGMGGSSLFPDVLARTFGPQPGAPRLRVLDSTDPVQIQELVDALDLPRTLFVYASKSGGTIEPAVAQQFFWARLRDAGCEPGRHFVAITDPGTALDALATRERFLETAHANPQIGGRFSALSPFGIVPALLAGLDARALLGRAVEMAELCRSEDARDNPGVSLGLALASAVEAGRDKLTLLTSPGIASFAGWLEQLVAESSGKHGRGIVPVADEPIAAPESYGHDRFFVAIELAGQSAPQAARSRLAALESAGHPCLRIALSDALDLGAEVFRWEIATAVACAALGVNAFDQPDVEAAKRAARALLDAHEEGRDPRPEQPLVSDGTLCVFAGDGVALQSCTTVEEALRVHLDGLAPGDYFAINAFLPMRQSVERALEPLRVAVRDARGVATSLGFGPRFLHSTGQLHKGGPNRGVFLALTWTPPIDLEIPGRQATFAALETAQALGDFTVLCERDRRALRVHIEPGRGDGLEAALAQLASTVRAALRLGA